MPIQHATVMPSNGPREHFLLAVASWRGRVSAGRAWMSTIDPYDADWAPAMPTNFDAKGPARWNGSAFRGSLDVIRTRALSNDVKKIPACAGRISCKRFFMFDAPPKGVEGALPGTVHAVTQARSRVDAGGNS